MSGLPTFGVEVALKSALVLALAAGTMVGFRRARAAARHQVWMLGLVLSALLPLLVLLVPEWRLPLLAPERRAVVAERGVASKAETASARSETADAPAVRPAPRPEAQPRAAAPRIRPSGLLLAAWALGALVLLARLAFGAARARALVRRGRALDLPELEAARREIALAREVRAITSDAVAVPMTAGALRPVLLLPRDFCSWSAERRRLVLLHELAHVRRGDWLTQLLSQVALAFHWFQPLAWVAARRVREEAEVAADDVVVAAGTLPSSYAKHLLEIVLSRPAVETAALTVPMGTSPLERRLRRLLAPGRKEGAWRMRIVLPVVAVTLTSLLAAARLVTAAPEPETTKSHPVESGAKGSDLLTTADEAASALGHHLVHLAQHIVHGDLSQKRERVHRSDGSESGEEYERGAEAYGQALELHNEGDYDRAIELWQESLAAGFRKGASAYNLACAYARKKETAQALTWLERAADEDFDLGDYIEKDRDLASLRSDPRFQKLEEQFGGGERQRALARVKRLSSGGSADSEAWHDVAKELYNVGEYDAAIGAWRRTLELEPASSTAMYNIACANALQGNTSEALDRLEESIQMGFGSAEQIEGDDDFEAIRNEARYKALVEEARQLELPDGAVGGGWIVGLLGARPSRTDWREAKARYESYLAAHPQSGRASFDLGFAHLRLGESQQAADAFERAFTLEHRPGPAAYNVACAYAAKGDADRALSWLARAKDAGFDDAGMLASDPDLDNIRDDPRFVALLRERAEKDVHRKVEMEEKGSKERAKAKVERSPV